MVKKAKTNTHRQTPARPVKKAKVKQVKRTLPPSSKGAKKASKTIYKPVLRTPSPKKITVKKDSRLLEVADLRMRLSEAEETLTAIRKGEVDAVVVSGPRGEQVYALKGAEQPYRILVESMNEGALTLTENSAIINCNLAFAKIARIPSGMLIGLSIMDMVSNNDRAKFEMLLKQTVDGEAKAEIELQFDGRKVPVYISLNARMHQGECWMFAVVTDISERKLTEAQLEEYRLHLEQMVDQKTEQLQVMTEELQITNEELQTTNEELQTTNEELQTTNDEVAAKTAEIEALINSISDAVIYSDMNGLVLMGNPSVKTVFGYEADELIRKTSQVLYADPEDFLRVEIERRSYIKNNKQPLYELQYRRKDGTLFIGNTRDALVRNPKGIPDGFISIHRDVTDQKRAEEAVAAAQRQIQSIIDNTKAIIYAFDLEERFLLANTAAAELLNSTPEQMIGKRRHDFMPKEDADWHEANDRKVIEAGLALEFEEHSQLKDRSSTWLTTKFALHDAQGNIYAVAGMSVDISERKKIEEEIEKLNDDLLDRNASLDLANKELESFIYSVSHDLRAPLRHIAGFSELLMKDIADKVDEKGTQYISRIRASAEKMSRLIDDLLNLSRISRQAIQRTEVDLSSIAASIVSELQEANPGRSVQIVIQEGLTAFADDGLTEVVLSNLLGNAWKYTAKTEHARIELGTMMDNGNIIYYVRDNGIGFNQNYADRMFWPFHRLHSDEEFDGTGIGLAIVDRIIRSHGGKVWAEGTEGKGATIYFSLS